MRHADMSTDDISTEEELATKLRRTSSKCKRKFFMARQKSKRWYLWFYSHQRLHHKMQYKITVMKIILNSQQMIKKIITILWNVKNIITLQ